MRILISAGEVSGDVHAARIVRILQRRLRDAEITGMAGPMMREAGCRALVDMESLNVMGVGEVVRALPRIRRARKALLSWAASCRPDVAILVDFPGFHMHLGSRLRRLGIPVIQYIAPKLWAWGAWRARRLRHAQDRLACIFPFEPDWFAKHGIAAEYVGNPSATECADGWSRAEFRRRLGLETGTRVLALLPGSRPLELARHVPLMAALWDRVRHQHPNLACVVPIAAGTDPSLLAPLLDRGALGLARTKAGFALRADAAAAVSGTATLELALWDVPSVLLYRTSPFTEFAARRVLRLRHIGLANILLGDRTVMPEVIQHQATPEHLASMLLPLLAGEEEAVRQRSAFTRLRRMLQGPDPASKVADIACRLGRTA